MQDANRNALNFEFICGCQEGWGPKATVCFTDNPEGFNTYLNLLLIFLSKQVIDSAKAAKMDLVGKDPRLGLTTMFYQSGDYDLSRVISRSGVVKGVQIGEVELSDETHVVAHNYVVSNLRCQLEHAAQSR